MYACWKLNYLERHLLFHDPLLHGYCARMKEVAADDQRVARREHRVDPAWIKDND